MELEDHHTMTWEEWQRWSSRNETFWYDTWVVVYENQSEHRDMVWKPRRLGVVIFGAVLAAWILAANIVLGVTLCRRQSKFNKLRPVNWLLLHFVLAEILTGSFVVPLNVKTEREGSWELGPGLCRAWLLLQILLASLTIWSALAVTLDRFVYVLHPHSYNRRMTGWRLTALLLAAWVVSVATIVPPALSMRQDPDFVLDEVCAMAMTRGYALGISFAAFFAPGVMLLLGTVGIVIVAMQAKSRHAQFYSTQDAQALCNAPNKCLPDPDSYVTYVDSQSMGNVALTTVAVNMSLIILWAPFYVLNVLIPFCDGMCVDPALWSLCVWLGYASAGISPALWFLDMEVRQHYKSLVTCRKDAIYYNANITTEPETAALDSNINNTNNCSNNSMHTSVEGKWRLNDEINIFKPYLLMK